MVRQNCLYSSLMELHFEPQAQSSFLGDSHLVLGVPVVDFHVLLEEHPVVAKIKRWQFKLFHKMLIEFFVHDLVIYM